MLVAIGFLATAAALYHMTVLNMQIDFRTAAMLRVYQVLGLAFIFIPINTLSYVGMPANKSNQISGMTNLFRNLGGGIGISLLGTFLQRLGQKHQVYLSAHTSAGDPLFQQRLEGLTRTFSNQGIAPDVAKSRAYAVIEQIIYGQATTLAYIDVISTMAVGILCMVPLVLIMKRPRRGAAPVAAH
jgi:DHA2 family multidrug resistance protein